MVLLAAIFFFSKINFLKIKLLRNIILDPVKLLGLIFVQTVSKDYNFMIFFQVHGQSVETGCIQVRPNLLVIIGTFSG